MKSSLMIVLIETEVLVIVIFMLICISLALNSDYFVCGADICSKNTVDQFCSSMLGMCHACADVKDGLQQQSSNCSSYCLDYFIEKRIADEKEHTDLVYACIILSVVIVCQLLCSILLLWKYRLKYCRTLSLRQPTTDDSVRTPDEQSQVDEAPDEHSQIDGANYCSGVSNCGCRIFCMSKQNKSDDTTEPAVDNNQEREVTTNAVQEASRDVHVK